MASVTYIFGSLFAFLALAAGVAAQSTGYAIEISGDCGPKELSIEYFITGPFGGYGNFIQTRADAAKYELPTQRDGRQARDLKVIVRSARCRPIIFDVPELTAAGETLEAKTTRIRRVEFRGRLTPLESVRSRRYVVTAEYFAHWKCEFLGVADCMIGPNLMAVADIAAGGYFRVELPDMVNDPSLTTFSSKGAFQFFIRDRKTGNILFTLRPQNNESGQFEVMAASKYRGETVLIAERSL